MKISDYRKFPYTVTPSEGAWTIELSGVDGAITEAKTEETIEEWALAVFVDMVEYYLQRRMVIHPAPEPKDGQRILVIPVVTALKVMLRSAMNERGISRSELARRMGTTSQSVVQSLALSKKATSIETLFKAFEAIGMTVEVIAE